MPDRLPVVIAFAGFAGLACQVVLWLVLDRPTHPIVTPALAFAGGLLSGPLIGWLIERAWQRLS